MAGFITTEGADYLMALFTGVEDVLNEYWIALVTEAVGAAQSGENIAEPLTDDYYRVPISIGPESWSIAYGTATNTVLVTFPIPGLEDWTGIVGWAICDAESGGRVLYAGDDEMFDIAVGDQTFLPAGAISLSIDLAGWREVT
jgi:hypothetical protein